MQHKHFIPKTMGIVLAAILFNSFNTAAQDKVFAYNNRTTIRNENPVPAASFKLNISQEHSDSLLFRVTVENPASDKLMLIIRDGNNLPLHQELLPVTPVYMARFNLQGLEDGNYTFEIRRGRTRLIEKTLGIRTETTINRTVSVE